MTEKILVIRHGALGDFVQSLGPFAAIRQAHPNAHITLLTAPFLKDFALQSSYFNDVWVDTRPRWSQLKAFFSLFLRLKKARFTHVYDLQTSKRTTLYYRLLKIITGKRMPLWSGHVASCDFPHCDEARTRSHTLDRQKAQLALAGIEHVPDPSFDWYTPATLPSLPTSPYALIVAQASLHRPDKCWPLPYYVEIINRLTEKGITSVLIGSAQDTVALPLPDHLHRHVEDWRGKTQLLDLITLGRQAACAIGNDTGPMHIFAIAGTPCWVLFSDASDPRLCAPRGANVSILHASSFEDLLPGMVWNSLEIALKESV